MNTYVIKQLVSRANGGDAEACYKLGLAYLEDENLRKDLKKAEKYLIKAAESGDANAQIELAKLNLEKWYLFGIGSVGGREKAIYWLEKAGSKSDEAMTMLGEIYGGISLDGGENTAANDIRKAEWWLEKPVKHGYAPAMFALASIYYDRGDKTKEELYKELFKNAAEKGHAVAQYYHGIILLSEDNREGVDWLTKSAKGGCNDARFHLATYYLYSETGKDVKKGIDLLEEAAEEGWSDAMCLLGNLYFDGDVVEKNGEKAFYWFCRPNKYDDLARLGKAKCYLHGCGVEKDEKKAFKMFKKLAVWFSSAKYYLGECYYNGFGTHKNVDKAREIWEIAAGRGDENAKNALKEYFGVQFIEEEDDD